MREIFSIRSPLWPSLVAVAFAVFYVVTQPGPVNFNDPYDYDHLAHSILEGTYDLTEDYVSAPVPSMQREPGYPLFRAAVYAVAGNDAAAILWIQALLCGFTVLLSALTARRLDPRWELPIAWLTALYPGFAVWAGQHYSEMFSAFLVALFAAAWVRVWERPSDDRRSLVTAGMAGLIMGALILTKAAFQLLPFFAVGLLLAVGPIRDRWKQALLIIAGCAIVVAPWMLRNAIMFDRAAITSRSGAIIYTRALKAQEPWSRLATSYGSVLVGEAVMLRLFPTAPPIIVQLWDKTWDVKGSLLSQGLRLYEADDVMLERGKEIIFSSPSVFARFILWSGIDEMRLFALSSPGSPKFGVELIANQHAKDGSLSAAHLAMVLVAHAVQLVWWFLIVCGFVVLVRVRAWRHPAVLFVGYSLLIYAAFDNIPRYTVPILPWVMALIVAALFPPVHRKEGSGSRILVLAESLDPRSGWATYAEGLVRALRARGSDITILTVDGSSDGPHLPGIHASRIQWIIAKWRLWVWLCTRSFDVIHVTAEPHASLFPAFGNTPFILTAHGTYVEPAAHGTRAARFRAALDRAQHIVAISAFTAERIPVGVTTPVTVIPNGVDLTIADEPFDPAPSHGSPLIIAVGAIKPRKGIDRLIAGFAVFHKTHPDAELVIIGRSDNPGMQESLERQIVSLGLASYVRILGEVSRPVLLGWYRECDVFALTTVVNGGFEGFGLIYLEANVFGKPCVGSRASAAAEVIREGETGFLADPDLPSDIASAIDRARALDAEDIRRSLAGAAWSDRARAYQEVYESCRNSR